MFTLSSLSSRDFHITSIHHSTWWCKKNLLSVLSCVKHFLSFLSIKCGFSCVITTSNHTRWSGTMSLVLWLLHIRITNNLGWVIMSLPISDLLSFRIYSFFCRHFDLPSFSIFLRVRQKERENLNWILPKHHWRLLLTAPNFCLIWFRSSQSLIVISTQTSPFYLLPMCDTSSICFSSYTFQHHFITFLCGLMRKITKKPRKINLCGLSDVSKVLFDSYIIFIGSECWNMNLLTYDERTKRKSRRNRKKKVDSMWNSFHLLSPDTFASKNSWRR